MEKPTFVWPPPEEDLEDWQVVPLFSPSAAEPLPEPVLVPEVVPEAMSSAVATTAPLVMAAGSARGRIQLPERLPAIGEIEKPAITEIETVSLTRPIVSAAPAPIASEAIEEIKPLAIVETTQAIDTLAIASPSPLPSITLTTPEMRSSGATGVRIVLAAALVCAVGGSAYVATRSFMPRLVATAPAAAVASKPTTPASAPAPAPVASTPTATDGVDATPEKANAPEIAPSANIPPVPGETSLEVRSLPAGAKVIFGGRDRGVTPLVITGLVPGRHDVMVEGPFPRVFRRVDVTEGERALLIVGGPTDASTRTADAPGTPATPAPPASVSPNGAPVAPVAATATPNASANGTSATPSTAAPIAPTTMGRLVVQSPLALDVIANGRRIGNSGDGSLPLAPGSHELELLNDSVDYREVTTVHISAGQRLVLPVEIPQSTLTVEASPGTRIWVDGRDVGEVNHAQLALPIGPHEVRFRHPDFGERRITALVKIGLAARAAVDFKSAQP